MEDYQFTSEDKLFLDANIWLYIYGLQPPVDKWVRVYSAALNRMLVAKSGIYIDVLIVSEFINVYAKKQWRLLKPKPNVSFKDFRNSPAFQPVAKDISDSVKRIVSHCSRVDSGFQTLGMDSLLDDYASGKLDFNDQVIMELCKAGDFTLVTNDADFRSEEFSILTANPRLLN